MKNLLKYLSTCLLATAALLGGTSPAWAQVSLGAASGFAVLSAAPGGGGAVTCTDSTITGDVGSSGLPAAVVQTGCTITGAIIAPVSAHVINDFNSAYAYDAAMAALCSQYQTLTGTLAGVTLPPGIYCFDAAATLTGTLTLAGPANGVWLFLVNGALTGTNFSVVMAGGAEPCNVYWWAAAAATMTTSDFKGTILAGAAITITGGTYAGRALAKAAVTLTGVAATGCGGGTVNPPPRQRCNQGVGNGPEGCDPGNSNQGNPARSNDELGGVPGSPGRKGK
jgi:hypothetical protein